MSSTEDASESLSFVILFLRGENDALLRRRRLGGVEGRREASMMFVVWRVKVTFISRDQDTVEVEILPTRCAHHESPRCRLVPIDCVLFKGVPDPGRMP